MAGRKGKTPKQAYKRQIGARRNNTWISHVKAYAAQHMVPYKIALQEASRTYR
jgi:hypothetical protein